MKENKNLLPAIILGVSLIIAVLINAFANRYEYNGATFVVDKWTSKAYPIRIQ